MKMTYTATTPKAAAVIASMTTRQLVDTFILTGNVNAPHIPTVRGWIMDELEARDPAAFDAWLEDYADDADLLKYFAC
jgi:hypothetical protein